MKDSTKGKKTANEFPKCKTEQQKPKQPPNIMLKVQFQSSGRQESSKNV